MLGIEENYFNIMRENSDILDYIDSSKVKQLCFPNLKKSTKS